MANVSSFTGAMPVIPGGTVELGYSQITTGVTVSSAAFPAGTEVIAPLTVVCDGGPLLVEFFTPSLRPNNTSGDEIWLSFFLDGSESIRQWGYATTPAANWNYQPTYLSTRISPSAGSHTFGVKSRVTNASRTGSVDAGTGASTTSAPAFLRVSKIVNQNDGLKPFWTPPVVTQLPSQATEGDQVLYRHSSSGGGQSLFTYNSGSWRPEGGLHLIQRKTLSAGTSISFDGCFSSMFNDYRILSTGGITTSATGGNVTMRMRASGTDNSGGTSYTYTGTKTASSSAVEATATSSFLVGYGGYNTSGSNWGNLVMDVQNPFAAQFTQIHTRNIGVDGTGSECSLTLSGSHRVATSYDGFTLTYPVAITTTVSVYGYAKDTA